MKTKTAVINLKAIIYKSSIFLLLFISVLLFLYAYFVLNSIYLVAERQNIEEKKAEYLTDITELAFDYMKKQENITRDQINKLGLVDYSNKSLYATRQSAGLTLTLLRDEI